jgi:DegV family protein with EDD domain
LVIRLGQQTYLDGELSTDEFWQKVKAGPHHPGTSQPSAGVFEEVFARLVDAGHRVLCLTITSKHSGTFGTAWAAAQRFGDWVRVMDSLSLSLGQGFQVLDAARAAAQGLGLDEVVELVERVRERSRLFILLNTIEYIRRGGRADALMPLLSRVTQVLRIKPLLTLAEGRLSLLSLARSYERGLTQIQREIARLGEVEHLAVVHTRSVEVAQRMAHTLAEGLGMPTQHILVTETGPLLSTHAGAKVIGVVAVQRAF